MLERRGSEDHVEQGRSVHRRQGSSSNAGAPPFVLATQERGEGGLPQGADRKRSPSRPSDLNVCFFFLRGREIQRNVIVL